MVLASRCENTGWKHPRPQSVGSWEGIMLDRSECLLLHFTVSFCPAFVASPCTLRRRGSCTHRVTSRTTHARAHLRGGDL